MIANPNQKFVQLADDHKNGKISNTQLDIECGYWLMECFHELHYKPMPTGPKEYQEFKDLTFEKRQKMSNEVHQYPIVKDYLEETARIKNENYSNLERLKEFKLYIPKEDFVAHAKYAEKINEFLNRGGGW